MIDINKIKQEKSIQQLLEFSIINIDKPSGRTSFEIDEIVKKKLNARKTSHFGTLDPAVTGVLPIAINRACKLSNYFMHRNKIYVGIMHLHSDIDKEKIEEEIKKFIGKIKQIPPVKSNVKREEREREIFSFKILEQVGRDILFETEVQAGTYIRKLISDMGENIGGAHMLELRRIKASIFQERDSINLYKFEKAVHEYKQGKENKLREILIPGEIITEILPVIQVKEESVKKLLTGKPIFNSDLVGESKKEGSVAAFQGNRFIGIYKIVNQGEILALPEFVMN